ncbi:acyl carrier protein [Alteromonas sp. I4]|nr:acyl carrier protein [Alteromonas sp. I4]|tara:strand:- start:17 stop:286 length:270 start_codon:yes stop_codon:yes gene_type:complete
MNIMNNEVNVDNQQKLAQAFTTALGISADTVTDELTYNTIPEWDSTAHMILIAELENVFDVMLDTDDIIDMSSVAQAKLILQKYDVSFG